MQNYMCKICLEQIAPEELDPLDTCGHMFHSVCTKRFLESQIEEKITELRCPLEDCRAEIFFREVVARVSRSAAKKYEDFSLSNVVDANPDDYSWCPTPDCNYVFIWEEEDGAEFECEKCGKSYCLDCRVEWHKGKSCAQYRASKKEKTDDEKFLKFVRGKKYKQCP